MGAPQGVAEAVGCVTPAQCRSVGSAARATMPAVTVEEQKQAAATAAAEVVEDGMIVGLGTGSTVAHLLTALSARRDGLPAVRYVATSPRTAELAARLGLRVEPFAAVDRLDLAIDGADQVAPDGWLVKGGGAAHTREKVVAAAAARFVVVVDAGKPVDRLRAPIPLEVLEFGLDSTLRRLAALGPVRRRDVPPSPDGGVIVDYVGVVGDPAELATRLSGTPGVVEHGLFPSAMVADVVIGTGDGVSWRKVRGAAT